jgi:predicted nucleic acid-binding protein
LKTFLDSGVLLTAWRGLISRHADSARSIMAHDGRKFFTSENVKLEVLPKPAFEKRQSEVDFYNDYFKAATIEPFSAELGDAALALAKKYGLAAGDALNLASAIRQGADEFITSELPGKPMFRVSGIKIISLHSL